MMYLRSEEVACGIESCLMTLSRFGGGRVTCGCPPQAFPEAGSPVATHYHATFVHIDSPLHGVSGHRLVPRLLVKKNCPSDATSMSSVSDSKLPVLERALWGFIKPSAQAPCFGVPGSEEPGSPRMRGPFSPFGVGGLRLGVFAFLPGAWKRTRQQKKPSGFVKCIGDWELKNPCLGRALVAAIGSSCSISWFSLWILKAMETGPQLPICIKCCHCWRWSGSSWPGAELSATCEQLVCSSCFSLWILRHAKMTPFDVFWHPKRVKTRHYWRWSGRS